MKSTLTGKKLLVLGGANQHLKIVEAAKEMGIYTIVTDYLFNSPCKRVCDESLMLNVSDVDGIVDYCRKNQVDGVISGFLDPCQIPYARICEELGLPCFGTPEQFFQFTNKIAFKRLCKLNGVNVIPDYSEADIKNDAIKYPVFVKPVDSRGSRGQTVCYSKKRILDAVRVAKEQSSNGEVLIEEFMGECDEVQITCFLIEGKIYLERTVDSYRGSAKRNLQKVVCCSVSPSKYTNDYLQSTHASVCRMIHALGIQNGPIFMQGFYKDGQFYFFDPGLRFPGVEFERIYKDVFGVDLAKLLIQFAFTGSFPQGTILPQNGANLNGRIGVVFFPTLNEGKIKKIVGLDRFCKDARVVSCLTRYAEGDIVNMTCDVNQRFAEIDAVCEDYEELAGVIDSFYAQVSVTDDSGHDMLYDRFDIKRLNE